MLQPAEKAVVSVILPCYNYAHFLGEALDSVLAQSYSHWECIIINDGSPDNTEEIALQYCNKDKRFKYLHKENGGPASARNFGIKLSAGKYILPLDPDDMIAEGFIEKALEIIESDPDVKIVASPAQMFGDVNKVIPIPAFNLRELLIVNYLFNTSLYRREDFDKTNGYDEEIFGLEDWDLWISILKTGGTVKVLPFAGYHYRQKNECVFRDLIRDKERLFRHQLKMYLNHIDVYKQQFDSPVHLIQENEKLNRVINNYQETRSYKWGYRIQNFKNRLRNFLK
ncbi:MAG: glycosyltransferase family 2 protein [Bacteroidota bacterium]|nr:glycosyltransferase family 2 protein [Bacteroidota bacterium]